MTMGSSHAIAIVGYGGIFPGADGPDEFWAAIVPRRAGVVFGNIVLPTERSSSFSREVLSPIIEEELGLSPSLGDRTDPLNAFPAGLPAALVAQALGLRGTAFTLDAACASSL